MVFLIRSLVRGSWKCTWWHYLSKSERDAYPFVSLSFIAHVMENLSIPAVKVIDPRYTYYPITSTCFLEGINNYIGRKLNRCVEDKDFSLPQVRY